MTALLLRFAALLCVMLLSACLAEGVVQVFAPKAPASERASIEAADPRDLVDVAEVEQEELEDAEDDVEHLSDRLSLGVSIGGRTECVVACARRGELQSTLRPPIV